MGKRIAVVVLVMTGLVGCGGTKTVTVTQPSAAAPSTQTARPCHHYRYVVGPDGHRHRQPCGTTPAPPAGPPVPLPTGGPQPGCMKPSEASCAPVPAQGTCHFRPGPLPDPNCTPG